MPLFFSYLIKEFFTVFILALLSFITILFTTRLEDIAHFASFGADLQLIGFFTLLQIPYILPIAIPVSCLISSVLLMQRLSKDKELTALRASGFSLKDILTPLLFIALILSLVNLYTVSELTSLSHRKANSLKLELREINPLLLLHNKALMRAKGAFCSTRGQSKLGEHAKDLLCAIPNEKTETILLLLADSIETGKEDLQSSGLSLISETKRGDGDFPTVLLETMDQSQISLVNFSHILGEKVFKVTNDSLSLKELLAKKEREKNALSALEENQVNEAARNTLKESIASLRSDLARRLSLGLSPLAFTLLGIAFGITLGRSPSPFKLAFPIGLAAVYLVLFFAGKATSGKPNLSFFLYLLPLFLISFFSLRKLSNVSRGIES